MMIAEVWDAIRADVRRWPGGRSIHDDFEPHTFAPTTFAVLAEEFADDRRILALIRKAESADWSRADGEALIDALADTFARDAATRGEQPFGEAVAAAFAAAQRRIDAIARRARSRSANAPTRERILEWAAKVPAKNVDKLRWIALKAHSDPDYVRQVLAAAARHRK